MKQKFPGIKQVGQSERHFWEIQKKKVDDKQSCRWFQVDVSQVKQKCSPECLRAMGCSRRCSGLSPRSPGRVIPAELHLSPPHQVTADNSACELLLTTMANGAFRFRGKLQGANNISSILLRPNKQWIPASGPLVRSWFQVLSLTQRQVGI